MTSADEPTEASPLTQEADTQPRNEEQERAQLSGWTEDAICTAVLATAFLTFYAFADILKYVSTIRLIELGVCREHYSERDPGIIDDVGNIPEDLCKSPAVQQQFAYLRGYLSALEAVVGLLLTLPYGLLIGRLGERLLAGVNIVGYLLSCAWLLAVCFFWSAFPIWAAVISPLFRVVGGGSAVLSSVIYSIAAKHVPGPKRSLCFFVFLAAQLLTGITSTLVTASLLDHGLLFTPMVLNFPIGLLCLATLVVMPAEKRAESRLGPGNEHDEEGANTLNYVQHSSRILTEILRERSVPLLLFTVPVAKMSNPVVELMFQYVPKKFDLSFAAASRALTISTAESLVLLLVILPLAKNVAQNRFQVLSARVDLYILRYGFLVEGLGCIIMASSQTLIIFILGLLVSSLGCSTRAALQSLLTDLVNREHIAVLYTVIALGDGVGSAAGALVLNKAFAVAIGWENNLYLGLPYIIGGACFVTAFVGSLFVGQSLL